MPDQGVHAAQRVLPVGFGEISGERVGDHLTEALPGLVVEISGVDQAGGVDLGVHNPCLPALSTGWCYDNGQPAGVEVSRPPRGDRGRAQWSRTYWPGRTWAALSMSSSVTTAT